MPSGHSAADIYIIGGRFDLLTGHWRLDGNFWKNSLRKDATLSIFMTLAFSSVVVLLLIVLDIEVTI